jgi:hypothetical protein
VLVLAAIGGITVAGTVLLVVYANIWYYLSRWRGEWS